MIVTITTVSGRVVVGGEKVDLADARAFMARFPGVALEARTGLASGIPRDYESGNTHARLSGRLVSQAHPDHPANWPGVRAQAAYEAGLRQ